MPTRALLATVLGFTLISVVISGIYGHFEAAAAGGGRFDGYIPGAFDGAFICSVLVSFEFLVGTWGVRLHQPPFLLQLALRSLVYLAVILTGLVVGRFLFPSPVESPEIVRHVDLVFALAMGIGFNLLYGINRLLGPGVLFSFAAGRYHRPRVETRALLFIDMESSTANAERLGELRFLVLLNRFVTDLTIAIAGEGGAIHKYVGDEVIATWRLGRGGAARAIRACFAARARLAANAAAYEREFGCRPDFRAALHCGPVVMGELGLLKMEIALIGDTMNSAARIQQACRDTGHRILASSALLERAGALPAGIAANPLGPLRLRGKEEALALFALEPASGDAARAAAE